MLNLFEHDRLSGQSCWTWELTSELVVSFSKCHFCLSHSVSRSLHSVSFVFLSKPQLVWTKLRWELHRLETTVSIMTARTPWGLNPWSWCLWLSVWIHTGQIGKTIMSYTCCCCCCCCLSGQKQYQFDSELPHLLSLLACALIHLLVEQCVCQYCSFSPLNSFNCGHFYAFAPSLYSLLCYSLMS